MNTIRRKRRSSASSSVGTRSTRRRGNGRQRWRPIELPLTRPQTKSKKTSQSPERPQTKSRKTSQSPEDIVENDIDHQINDKVEHEKCVVDNGFRSDSDEEEDNPKEEAEEEEVEDAVEETIDECADENEQDCGDVSLLTDCSTLSPCKDTTEGDDVNQRKLNLIMTYNRGSKKEYNDVVMKMLARCLRVEILPKMKFVRGGRTFGSFNQPDFSDKKCWVNKLFSMIPVLDNGTDRYKAEIWMTYRVKIKEQFSLHRSSKSARIKTNFLRGEYI